MVQTVLVSGRAAHCAIQGACLRFLRRRRSKAIPAGVGGAAAAATYKA